MGTLIAIIISLATLTYQSDITSTGTDGSGDPYATQSVVDDDIEGM